LTGYSTDAWTTPDPHRRFDGERRRGPVFGSPECATLAVVGQFGAWPTGTGFGVELFPTALRALGVAAGTVFAVVEQSASFVLAGILIHAGGGLAPAAVILAAGSLIGVVLIAVSFPETSGRELEAISVDLDGPGGV
jgi:hypothetical protein